MKEALSFIFACWDDLISPRYEYHILRYSNYCRAKKLNKKTIMSQLKVTANLLLSFLSCRPYSLTVPSYNRTQIQNGKVWVRCLKTSYVWRYCSSSLWVVIHKTNHSIQILLCFAIIDDEEERHRMQNVFFKPILTELVCHLPRAY